MTLNEFLTVLTRIVYVLVAIVTLTQWLRTRDRTRLDIALVFVSLGLTIVIQGAEQIFGRPIQWLENIGTLALLAHPYFLLRIAHYFRPVPPIVRRAALLGLAVSWTALILSGTTPSIPLILLIVVYFAGVEVYATSIFIRGALTTGGITRQRLRLASTGSGLLAGIILLAGVLVVLPAEVIPFFTPLTQVFALLAGLGYYFGFSPPRWLRQAWQLNEFHNYLRETSGQWAQQRSNTFKHLSTAAVRVTGGTTAVIALWDFEEKSLKIDAPGEPP